MSCAYRSHRYRASVTAHPASVSWQPPTGHARHPISLHPPVVRPGRQVVTETGTSTDDASIPVSLVQYLWSRWQESPPDVRDAVTAVIGELMRSPRWHWDVTVLPDHAPTDPSNPFVIARDGRPTIGMPIAMLRALWMWVVHNAAQRASILQWCASSIDPPRWQELRAALQAHVPPISADEWCHLYGYLSPCLLPDIAEQTHQMLHANVPDEQQAALTILDRWLASADSATRTLATQMLRTWLDERGADDPTTHHRWIAAITGLRLSRERDTTLVSERWTHVVAAIMHSPLSNETIRDALHGLVRTILTTTHPVNRVAWVTTLWTVMTDPTCPERRRQMIAAALKRMMQDSRVATLARHLLQAGLSHQRPMPEPVWHTLLEGFMTTAEAGAALDVIAQAIRQYPSTIDRWTSIVATGWGNGHDQRILQIIDSIPGRHWKTVLIAGITTSVGEAVCDRIGSWFSRDQALALIVDHIRAREDRKDWPLAPLPAHLIPWVCEAARSYPDHLHPTTIRRLWLADPDLAWRLTQTMLESHASTAQQHALAAMDAGWGRGHDDTIAATLLPRILTSRHQSTVETGIATAVAGIGIAPRSIMESLLTRLATMGDAPVRRQLISALHRGWGRGQDTLVLRVVEIIAERDSSERIKSHETLLRAWDYLPPQVVMHLIYLIDRLLTHAMNGLANEVNDGKRVRMLPLAEHAIAALAPIWTHLPTPQVIAYIQRHVDHLSRLAPTLALHMRDNLVCAWALMITKGVTRVSVSESDVHACLSPLWNLSPRWCLNGVMWAVP